MSSKKFELPMKQIYSFDNNSVWAHRCRHGVGGFFLATFRCKMRVLKNGLRLDKSLGWVRPW